MPGPAKLPHHLKLIRGTARRDRAARAASALPPIDAAPTPPRWLTDPEARAEWDRLVPLMIATKLLNRGNVTILAQYCATHGRLVQIWRSGDTPPAAHLSALRTFAGALGLLGWNLPSGPEPENPFEKFLKR